MTLTGILKNILLVIASVMIWHTSITWLQFLGYGVALAGMVYYSLGWEQIKSTSFTAANWARTQWNSPLDENRLSPLVRRAIFIGLLLLVTLLVGVGMTYNGSAPSGNPWNQEWLSYLGIGSST
jgi:hypothetical protein